MLPDPEPNPASTAAADAIAFLIFEGGGAKGIAHLGALKAMEDLGFAFAGVAGTSAGAFVAALVATGYRSAELLDPDAPSKNLLSTTGDDPIGLLGLREWRRFNWLRRAARRAAIGGLLTGLAGATLLAPRAIGVLARLLLNLGHFSTDGVRDFVNARMRERLQDIWAEAGLDFTHLPALICFEDLDYTRFPQLRPLKIIATDTTAMKPVLFDSGETPCVVVGDAVAASLAIPFFFRPVRVRQRGADGVLGEMPGLFADGGLVSNLPFWVFNEEKSALERTRPHNHPVPIVAFSLTDATHHHDSAAVPDHAAPADRPGPLHFLTQTVRTAIFGSQSIAQGLLRDLVVVRLSTKLGVLGFDAPWPAIRADYISGRQCALRRVKVVLQQRPAMIKAWLQETANGVTARLAGLPAPPPLPPRLRACLIEPFGSHSLRVSHGFNMENDADDRLLLDRNAGRGAPVAFRTRDLQLLRLDGVAQTGDRMSKYERALVRPGLRSALCVPIFRDLGEWAKADGRAEPLGVLCLDSDHDLTEALINDMVVRFVVSQTGLFAPMFDME